jgi:hypothetical protein
MFQDVCGSNSENKKGLVKKHEIDQYNGKRPVMILIL